MAVIRTPRLELLAADEAHLRAEIAGREVFVTALGATVPPEWPPELYGGDDGAAAQWVLARMTLSPGDRRFFQFYFLRVEDGARTLVGVGGFKGPPVDGVVELGYEILEPYRRRGYASEATSGMLSYAFSYDDVRAVCAQTLPHLVASIGVLEKCGLRLTGPGEAEGVIRFEIERAAWLRHTTPGGNVTRGLEAS